MRKLVVVFVVLFCPFIDKAGESGVPKESFFSFIKEYVEKEFFSKVRHKKRCAEYVASLEKAIENNDTPAVLALLQSCPPKLDQESKSALDLLLFAHQKLIPYEILRAYLFDNKIALHDQDFIMKKIVKYLEKELEGAVSEEDRKNRQEIIEYFKRSYGECTGLSSLWSYGKRIEGEPLSSADAKKDDILFFNTMMRTLAIWDGESELTKLQKDDIEHFVSNVILFQSSLGAFLDGSGPRQANLAIYLEDTKRGSPVKIFRESFWVNQLMLVSRLKRVVKPKTMILIGADSLGLGKHTMAVYQDTPNSPLCFYNSNDIEGETEAESFEELAALIWKGSSLNSPRASHKDYLVRSMFFAIFQFSDGPFYEYPTQKDLEWTEAEKEAMKVEQEAWTEEVEQAIE